MSYARVYIHFVWGTKMRMPFLNTPAIRIKVWKHIKEYARQKGIHIECVNGYDDHCHCLVSMSRDQTMSKIMHLIKGESARWINEHHVCPGHFEWQSHYYAISVSESIIERVRNYIKNHEKHHSIESYQKEVDLIIKRHKFRIKGEM